MHSAQGLFLFTINYNILRRFYHQVATYIRSYAGLRRCCLYIYTMYVENCLLSATVLRRIDTTLCSQPISAILKQARVGYVRSLLYFDMEHCSQGVVGFVCTYRYTTKWRHWGIFIHWESKLHISPNAVRVEIPLALNSQRLRYRHMSSCMTGIRMCFLSCARRTQKFSGKNYSENKNFQQLNADQEVSAGFRAQSLRAQSAPSDEWSKSHRH